MNRLVWVMLVFLVVCTIAIGLISCGPKDRSEPNEPVVSDDADDEPAVFEPDDEEDTEKDKDDEEEEEEKPPVPTINPPSSGGTVNTWTPPAYVPPTTTVLPPDNLASTEGEDITYSKSGTYSTSAVYETVTIKAKGVILSNKTVNGDLIITEDVGTGDVYLNNISIGGTLYVYGGGENSIHLDDVTVNKIVVNKGKRGRVRLIATGKTSVRLVEAYSGIILKETALNHNYDGFYNITTKSGNKLSSVQVTLYGCDINEIYALEETTLSIKSGCEIDLVNGEKDYITVNGEWSAINRRKGDVDRGSSGGSSGGGGSSSSSKSRISTPKNLSVKQVGNFLMLSWDSVSKADNYTVMVNNKTKDYSYSSYIGADITELIPEGKNNLSISVRANRSSSSYKDSYYSNTLTYNNVVKPKAVTGATLTLSSDGKTMTAAWNAPTDLYRQEYLVELIDKATGAVIRSNTVADGQNQLVYHVNAAVSNLSLDSNTQTLNASNGVTYYARITVLPWVTTGDIGLQVSSISSECTYVNNTKLEAPADLKASYNNATHVVTLTWEPVIGASKYEIYKNNASTAVASPASSPATVTLSENDLKAAVTFTIKAIDTDSRLNSELSAEARIEKLDPPTAPTTSYSNGVTTLIWGSVTDATSYDLALDDRTPVSYTATTTDISSIPVGSHTYKVAAKAAGKITSEYAAGTSFIKPGIPVPTVTSGTPAAMTWGAIENATTYEVYNSTGTRVQNNTELKYIRTEPGTDSYYVIAVTADGKVGSAKSSSVSLTVPTPATPLAEPTVTLEAPNVVTLDGETPNYRLSITAPKATNVTMVKNDNSNVQVNGSAPSFTAMIPAENSDYIITAVGDGTTYENSPAKTVTITVTNTTPTLILNNGVVTNNENAPMYLNNTRIGSPINLSEKSPGDYTVSATLEPSCSGYNIDLGGTVSETYTVEDGTVPTVKPVVTKSSDAEFTINIATVENFKYSYAANVTRTVSDATTTDSTSLPLTVTNGKFAATQLGNNVSSFTVTVTATPEKEVICSGSTITKYGASPITLTSEKVTLPPPSANTEETPPAEAVDPNTENTENNTDTTDPGITE